MEDQRLTDAERQALAAFMRNRRDALHISARELGRRAGVDNATIALLEQCKIAHPRSETLRAIADGLDVPLSDLYAAANWLPESSLPSLRPYMRAKYDVLPEEALAEVERVITRLTKKYSRGPTPGEDE